MIVRGIHAINFRGIRDQMLQTRPGGFVISGTNGSGKSSWIYALRFCFYGRVPDLNIGDILNWDADEGSVTTWFDIGENQYCARRSFNAKTSRLEVRQLINGEWENIGGNTTVEANEVLAKILRIPEEVFDQIVIKQQGEFSALTKATPSARYEIFKKFADVEMWEKYGKKNDEILRKIEDDVIRLQQTVETSLSTISSLNLAPVDPKEIEDLEARVLHLRQVKEALSAEWTQTLAFEKDLADYQLAQIAVEQYKDAPIWAERWQSLKDIVEPEVKFSPEKLETARQHLKKIEENTATLPKRIKELEEEVAKIGPAMESLLSARPEIQSKIDKAKAHNNELDQKIRELDRKKNLIAKGQCPECERPFHGAEDQIKELEEAIQELTNQKTDLSGFESAQKELEKDIHDLRIEWEKKHGRLTLLWGDQNAATQNIEDLKAEIEALEGSKEQTELWNKRQAFIEQYPYKDKGSPQEVYQMWLGACAIKDPRIEAGDNLPRSSDDIKRELEQVELDIQTAVAKIHSLKERDKNFRYQHGKAEEAKRSLQDLKPELDLHKKLRIIYGKNGAPRRVVDRWIHAVQIETNRQLDRLTGGKFSIEFIGKTDTGRNTIDLVITDNTKGKSRKIRSLSGGEETRVNVALALGLTNTFSNLSGIEVDTLLFDEVYGLDEQGQYDFAESIKIIANTKAVVGAISCFESMTAYFDTKLVMQDGVLQES